MSPLGKKLWYELTLCEIPETPHERTFNNTPNWKELLSEHTYFKTQGSLTLINKPRENQISHILLLTDIYLFLYNNDLENKVADANSSISLKVKSLNT